MRAPDVGGCLTLPAHGPLLDALAKLPKVARESAKDPVFPVSYPSGPVVCFSGHEFRLSGPEFVRRHFDEYSRLRLNQKDTVPVVFEEGSKFALKDTIPLMIGTNGFTKGLTIAPQRFRKLDIGGLRSFDADLDRHLVPGFSDAEFWQAFDAALSDAG